MHPLNYETFIPQLVKQVPELERAFAEHLETHGEINQHVFFGDLVRFVKDSIQGLPTGNVARLEAIAEMMNQALLSSDELLRNLASVSFAESISSAEHRKAIRALGKEALNQEISIYWDD